MSQKRSNPLVKTTTGLLAALIIASPAYAQQNCNQRDVIVSQLQGKYGENRRSLGVSRRGLIEVWASEETGSWTITVTTPHGMTCLIDAGEGFEETPDQGTPT